jgi:hypothetical protein
MGLPESDVDLAISMPCLPRFLMEGHPYPRTLGQRKSFRHELEYDELYWEIGHLVDQLIRTNINAIWITASPIAIKYIPDLPCAEEYSSIQPLQWNLSLHPGSGREPFEGGRTGFQAQWTKASARPSGPSNSTLDF